MLRQIEAVPLAIVGKSNGSSRLLLIHGLRSGLLVAIFLLALVFQLLQNDFLSPSIWLPVYGVLMALFALNSIYFIFSDQLEDHTWVHAGLFALDAVAVTLIVHQTGASQSIFFFIYLFDIVLAGLVFQKRGAYTQALWTSILFAMLFLLTPQAERGNVYFLTTLNNLAFFSAAYLSSHLSEQINFMGAELKKTTRSLARLEDLNQMIISNIGTGLITVDSLGLIVTANPAAVNILDGLHLLNRSIREVFPQIRIGENVVWLHSQTNEIQRQDLTYVNKTHEKLQIETIISPLKSEIGETQGHVILFQDRSEVRRLENAVRQKEKLAAVGQLAAGIAHEIRNPLASLSGSVQLMQSQPEKYGAEDLKLMRIITREIDRLNDLITEFLDYVKPETPPDEVVDMNKLLREVAEIVRFNPTLNQKVEQVMRLKAGSKILGRVDKLKQAFLNIIMNSYQAMESSVTPQIVIETLDVQDRFVVKVKDQGLGMDEAVRARIFEPFYTTKPKGTGLGLAVSHKILESHGAIVQVESLKGQGTTFIIDFPAEKDFYKPLRPTLKQA